MHESTLTLPSESSNILLHTLLLRNSIKIRRLEALGNETFQALLSDPTAFLSVVVNHVLPGVFPSVLLTDGITTNAIAGYPLTVSIVGETVMINDATVVLPDILASNGIVHIIDKVLLAATPPAPTAPAPTPGVPGTGGDTPGPSASIAPSYSEMPVPTLDGPPLGPMTVPPVPGPTPMPIAAQVPSSVGSTSGAFHAGSLLGAMATVFLVVFMV
jgi:Fasciclin domain